VISADISLPSEDNGKSLLILSRNEQQQAQSDLMEKSRAKASLSACDAQKVSKRAADSDWAAAQERTPNKTNSLFEVIRKDEN
jgi:hypothetical protein